MLETQTAAYDADPALAYLSSSSAFFAGNVAEAVSQLGVRDGMRVLDAGTGGGVAIRPLADAVGRSGHVLAIDISPKALALATARAGLGTAPHVQIALKDLRALAGEQPASFDLIWAGDLFWPGNFADPADMLRTTVGLLAPGGRLALYTSNYYQATFLPAWSQLDLRLRAASLRRWKLPADGDPTHHERHVQWLAAAGLEDVSLRVIPRVGYPVGPGQRVVRDYLEHAVWPDFLQAAREHGAAVGLDPRQRALVEELLTPGLSTYVVDQPGYYVMHPALVVTGRRARNAPAG